MRKQVAIITGASGGIGSTRLVLRENIDEIWAIARNREKLDALKKDFGDKIIAISQDLGDADAMRSLADMLRTENPVVAYLINNAGVWLDHTSGDILSGHQDYDAIFEQFNVNAVGAIRVIEALVQPLLKGFDKLVANISSEAGSIDGNSKPDQLGYCMSKAAMNMMSCCVLYAIRPKGGMVLNFHPGWMQSVIGGPAGPDGPFVELPRVEDVKFYVTPAQSAEGIMKVLDEPERFSGKNPGFVNYRGDRMQY